MVTHTPHRDKLLAVDWGTSALRGALLDADGKVLDQRATDRGILQVAPGAFAQVFEEIFGDWAQDHAGLCLVSGMAGSQQGWRQAPYGPCPAGFDDVAERLCWIDDAGLTLPLAIVPGLSCQHSADLPGLPSLPDVMRGEEVQIFGAMALTGRQDGMFVLPGTHNKWVRVQDGRVVDFQTFMTGEVYALLSRQSLLARSIDADAAFDEAAFALGLARATQGAGLLHNAFGTRTLALFEKLNAAQLASYLSGLVIGEELRALVLPPGDEVVLIGSATLTQRYALALELRGVPTLCLGSEATWAGHHALAARVSRRR